MMVSMPFILILRIEMNIEDEYLCMDDERRYKLLTLPFLLLEDFDDEGHFELFMLKTSRVNYSCMELLLILFLFLF